MRYAVGGRYPQGGKVTFDLMIDENNLVHIARYTPEWTLFMDDWQTHHNPDPPFLTVEAFEDNKFTLRKAEFKMFVQWLQNILENNEQEIPPRQQSLEGEWYKLEDDNNG